MDQVSEIREKIEIVSLIATYIPIKKMGNNFKAICPFHNEKTPSFVISPERQIWHCFGCGRGGDAFSFLMEYEHIEFPEALRILAEKTGVNLQQKGFDSATSSKKETMYRLNRLSAEFYHFLLTKHPIGKQAMAYLTERKIKPQTIETYMLGFAPSGGSALTTYLLQKKKYKPEELLEAGLATKRIGKIVDFFADRLMFPLFDHRDNVIGFAGRIMHIKEDSAKYINTRETLVYHKGSVFFGLNGSKEYIKKKEQAIIMEGEFDVIAAFQEGITNTVAIKGTALTEEQVNLISRYAKKVTLCFDDDGPGQEAMKRSLPILERKGLTTTVIVIPNGKDPDEAIKQDAVAFKKAVRQDLPIYDVLLSQALHKYSVTSAEGKRKIGEELLPHIAQIGNEIVKEHYLRAIAKAINTSVDVLIKELEKQSKKEVVKEDMVVTNKGKKPREEILEEYLIALIVQHHNPQLATSDLQQFIAAYTWEIQSLGKIAKIFLEQSVSSSFSIKTFVKILPSELLPAFDTCFLLPLPFFKNEEEYGKEIAKTMYELSVLGLKNDIKKLTKQIGVYEKEGNEEKLIACQEQLQILLSTLSKKENG